VGLHLCDGLQLTPEERLATTPTVSTPIAIIAAGALIGAGLFFGLRSRTSASAPETAAVPTTASSPAAEARARDAAPALETSVDTSTGIVATAGSKPGTADVKAATTASRLALEKHRKTMVDQCLAPALAKQPEPAKVNLSFSFSFDAAGAQTARGISEDRATSRPDVTQCIQQKLPAITIPAPGGAVFIEAVVWTLP